MTKKKIFVGELLQEPPKNLNPHSTKKPMVVGIDTGVTTGLAISHYGKLVVCGSGTITQAMQYLLDNCPPESTKIYIEDARQWVGYDGKTDKNDSRLQGAGSIKRDAKMWEDWCKEYKYNDVVFIAPMGNAQKMDAKKFKMVTGWQGKTNEHARDAGIIAFVRGQR